MRYFATIVSGLALTTMGAACATRGPEAPVGAQTVNADIEQRITSEVQEGRKRGFPDLADVRTEPPKMDTPAQRDAAQRALLSEAATLTSAVASDAAAVASDSVADEKAAALKAAVERDRAAVKADKLLSKNPPVRPE